MKYTLNRLTCHVKIGFQKRSDSCLKINLWHVKYQTEPSFFLRGRLNSYKVLLYFLLGCNLLSSYLINPKR